MIVRVIDHGREVWHQNVGELLHTNYYLRLSLGAPEWHAVNYWRGSGRVSVLAGETAEDIVQLLREEQNGQC